MSGPDAHPHEVSHGAASLDGCVTKLHAVRSELDELSERTAAVAERLHYLDLQAEAALPVGRTIAQLEKRLAEVEAAVQSAEARAAAAAQQGTATEQQHAALQQTIAAAHQTAGRIENARREAASFGQLEQQLPKVSAECKRIVDQQSALSGELEVLRNTTAALSEEATATRHAAREARENADRAADTIVGVQEKLDTLSQFEALTVDTGAQLQTLNALAGHVSSKLKALENQHEMAERALVESRRVNELVWDMEAQIARLAEAPALATAVEDTLARLERLHQDSARQLEDAMRARGAYGESVEQQTQEARELLQTLRAQLDRLALHKNEMQTLEQRLSAAHAALLSAEQRVSDVSTREQAMSGICETVDGLATRLGEQIVQAQTLSEKQTQLTALGERLETLDAAIKRTDRQFEALERRRSEVDALKTQFDACDATYAATQELLDGLRASKHEFARFLEQAGTFMDEAATLQKALDDIGSRVGAVEAGAARATAMAPNVDALTDVLSRLTPRLQIVEQLQQRLDGLHELSADVDRKLRDQLGRRAELDAAAVVCDGLATQLSDAQEKLAGLAAAQARLSSTPAQLEQLERELTSTGDRLQALRKDDEAVAAQEQRLVALTDAGRALSREIADRIDVVRCLQHDLESAGALRQQLCSDVQQLHGMQHETFVKLHDADDQIQQLDERWKQIDDRKTLLDRVEHTMTALERRLEALDRMDERVRAKVAGLADRERIVESVREQIDAIHDVARQTQSELTALAGKRAEIEQHKMDVDRLSLQLTATDDKLADLDRRGGVVDEVRRKADAVACLLEDVRVTLDSVGEQKAMIDTVADKLVRLDDVMAEARSTTRALQAERKVAQRIMENIRTIHARAGAEIRQVG